MPSNSVSNVDPPSNSHQCGIGDILQSTDLTIESSELTKDEIYGLGHKKSKILRFIFSD